MKNQYDTSVNGLNVQYGTTKILKDINLSVKQGEFVSIVGKSGCGKTTLLLAIAGFIDVNGTVKRPNRISVVFQNYAIYPWLTVYGNIVLGLHNMTRKDRDNAANEYLSLLDLEEHRFKYPGQLSGGQAQRVALARALAQKPDLVLLDEPFGALDIFTREKLQDWILKVWDKKHKTAIFVTHSIEESILLSEKVIVMGNGVILKEVPIPLGKKRTQTIKYDKKFIELKREISNILSSENFET